LSVAPVAEKTLVSFELAQALPTPNLPVVYTARKSPEANAAEGRRAYELTRAIETSGSAIVDKRIGPISGTVIGAAVICGTMAGIFFSGTGLAALFGTPGAGTPAMVTGALTALSLVVSASAGHATRYKVDRRLKNTLGHELTELERLAKSNDELTRAWAVKRAKHCVAILGGGEAESPSSSQKAGYLISPPVRDSAFVKRLGALIEETQPAGAAATEEADRLDELYRLTFAMTWSSSDPTGATKPAWGLEQDVELIISKIEKLSPEGRALLTSSFRDAIVTTLTQGSGNDWRVKRFLEACDGKRTAYAGTPEVIADTNLQPAIIQRLQKARWGVVGDLQAASDCITALFAMDTENALNIAPAIAEPLAAFWESRGYRVKLKGEDDKWVKVTVYSPDDPPKAKSPWG
jgi:hypothetical protein